MAQSTILASGTSSATSTDITLTEGTSCLVGFFASASESVNVPDDFALGQLVLDTPGSVDSVLFVFTPKTPQTGVTSLTGMGDLTLRVKRNPCAIASGVFLNQA